MQIENWVLVQISACWFMTGLIWLVQVVHYPGFRFIADVSFSEFHDFHSRRITWIVFPVMSAELLSAAVLAYQTDSLFWRGNLASVAVLWILTGRLSVPIHNKLSLNKSLPLIQRLVLTNWPRTLIWSLRAVVIAVSIAF